MTEISLAVGVRIAAEENRRYRAVGKQAGSTILHYDVLRVFKRVNYAVVHLNVLGKIRNVLVPIPSVLLRVAAAPPDAILEVRLTVIVVLKTAAHNLVGIKLTYWRRCAARVGDVRVGLQVADMNNTGKAHVVRVSEGIVIIL